MKFLKYYLKIFITIIIIMNLNNLKVAVITQSYYRKDGSTKRNLQNMFKMLEEQTYKNFKVFITGDNYQPEREFLEECNKYRGEIYVHNNNHSCRDLNLGSKIYNYWACGGVHAAYNSYIKSYEDGYNILLMLDDDDYWYPFHINNVVDNFIKYPETGFMVTNAEYVNRTLPRTNVNRIFYNNYIPRSKDCVRASTAHNSHIVGEIVIKFYKDLIDNVEKSQSSETKIDFQPGDGVLLDLFNKNIRDGKYKSLYIPIISVKKATDCNTKNIK